MGQHPLHILLLSAYDAMSHRYWRQALVAQFPEHSWTVLTLPARYFSWRLRGNSLSWGFNERQTLEQDYDLLITTSMTDLSALRGFVPNLGHIPTLVYFHENQFAYPSSANTRASVEPCILNLYTALAADHICFNSDYNRETFFQGAEQLLNQLPDHVPGNLIPQLRNRCSVLPVPLQQQAFQVSAPREGPLHLVWNHRWEYDKNPQLLLDALRILKAQGESFRLSVVGQQFRQIPEALQAIKSEFTDCLEHWGYLSSAEDYRKLLRQADVVLSTADHDFQGIAVLEGVAAGCIPVVPDRLAYRELFDRQFRYSVCQNDNSATEAAALALHLAQRARQKQETGLPDAPDIRWLSWPRQRQAYAEKIQAMTQSGSPGAE